MSHGIYHAIIEHVKSRRVFSKGTKKLPYRKLFVYGVYITIFVLSLLASVIDFLIGNMVDVPIDLLYGFLTWLIPFIIAIPFYSRDGQPLIDIFLLKSIMIVVGSTTGAIFLILYFKKVTENHL